MSFFSRGSLLLSVVALACSSSGSGPVTFAPTLVFPEGLLDGVTTLKVSVYDPAGGALSCNTMNGTVTGLTNQQPLSSTNLSSSGCNAGVSFCGSLSVSKTSDTRLFAAQAFVGTASSPVASGCTAMAPNQDNIEVMIKMLRTLPPQTCNGMPASMPVQCTTGSTTDPVCDQNCQSIEELYSVPDNSSTGATSQKVRPLLVWPAGSGPTSRLVGVWGEKKSSGTIVAMRTLDDAMEPNAQGSMCVMTESFRVPTNGALPPCPGQSYTLSQFNPAIADLNNKYVIAYEDNSAGTQAISLLTLDQSLQPTGPLNLSPSPAAAQSAPSLAVSGSNLFVAWSNGAGAIVGKMVTNGTTAGSLQMLGTGSNVTVAGTASGWVAVFLNGGDVDMVSIDASGTPGSVTKVNSASGASHPGVAAFGSTVAVIWADSGGNILVQRYQNGTAVAGDSANAIQDGSLGGNQKEPSIAAGSNFFVATWVDGGSGDVRARFLDGNNGYMFNLVNGQNTDFKASVFEQRTRDNPIAVAGGSGPYVAIAWEDNTGAPGSYMGIWGRRFPLPQ